jgi:uncharacterized membrane protein
MEFANPRGRDGPALPREPGGPPGRAADLDSAASSLSEHISQNIADIGELQKTESDATSPAQRQLERVSGAMARPAYIVGLLLVAGSWITFNVIRTRLGAEPIDPPPFSWLQGTLTLVALLTATVVLIAQSRQTRLSEQRAHLDLQINLLTEQKVTKLIHLVEELRRDLPGVRDRDDPHVTVLKEKADAAQVVSALKSSELASGPGRGERTKK